MFKKLWHYILSLFAASKEPRWERLDRLAETNPEKYQRELEKLSMKELNEYMDSAMTDVADRMQYGWNDLHPDVADGVKHSQLTVIGIDMAAREAAAEGTVTLQVSDGGEIKVLSREEVQKPADPREAPTDYHWAPGQEHSEPTRVTTPRRRQRPGVFERQAFNRKERRQAAAVSRREKKRAGGA